MTKVIDNPENQSKLEHNARSRRKARENVCRESRLVLFYSWLNEKVAQAFYANSAAGGVMHTNTSWH